MESDCKELQQLAEQYDKIQSLITRKKNKKKKQKNRSTRNLQCAFRRYHLQRKLAVFLCKNYRVVLIGKLSVSKCLNKKDKKRNIRRSTARSLQMWSHYNFRQLLKDKAELYSWCQVIEVTEEFTSQTCGRCGNVDSNIGGSKVYECKKCGFTLDRDVNGARNILLKFLSEYCKLLDD